MTSFNKHTQITHGNVVIIFDAEESVLKLGLELCYAGRNDKCIVQ